MRTTAMVVRLVNRTPGRQVGLVVALVLTLWGSGAAQEICQPKPVDPRSARLQVLDLQVSRSQIAGRVRNTSGETALGVMVWLNYYVSRRGGLTAQQCIAVGDLQPGEERPFLGSTIPEAEKIESYNYSTDAVGWR